MGDKSCQTPKMMYETTCISQDWWRTDHHGLLQVGGFDLPRRICSGEARRSLSTLSAPTSPTMPSAAPLTVAPWSINRFIFGPDPMLFYLLALSSFISDLDTMLFDPLAKFRIQLKSILLCSAHFPNPVRSPKETPAISSNKINAA